PGCGQPPRRPPGTRGAPPRIRVHLRTVLATGRPPYRRCSPPRQAGYVRRARLDEGTPMSLGVIAFHRPGCPPDPEGSWAPVAVSASIGTCPALAGVEPWLGVLPRAWVRVMSLDERDLDNLIEEITVDSYGEDEEMSSFECAFDELGTLPDATVIGEPVEV